jgi:hypothetical protein
LQQENADLRINGASSPQDVGILEADPCAVFAVLHQVAAMKGDGSFLHGGPREEFDRLGGFVGVDDSSSNSFDQFGCVRFAVFPVSGEGATGGDAEEFAGVIGAGVGMSRSDYDVIARDSGLLLDLFTDLDSEIRGDGDQVTDDEDSGKIPLSENDRLGLERIFGSSRKSFAVVAADRIVGAGGDVGGSYADTEFFGDERGSGRDEYGKREE